MTYFNLSGNMPEFRNVLQIYVKGDMMYGALYLRVSHDWTIV